MNGEELRVRIVTMREIKLVKKGIGGMVHIQV